MTKQPKTSQLFFPSQWTNLGAFSFSASKYRTHTKLFSMPSGLNAAPSRLKTKAGPSRFTPKLSVYEVCGWCYPCWKCCINCQLLGGTITRTTAGLLGHNSVGVLCAQRAKEASPLRLCYQQLLSIALMKRSDYYTLSHTGPQHRNT